MTLKSPIKCWICGDDATSGEHKTKKSDLKALFGVPTRNNPLYYHDDRAKNKPIGSLDSKILKSPIRICAPCNNARTQPHDHAWKEMSGWLRQCQPPVKPGRVVRGNRIWPYDTKRQMVNVHLYFLKLFGCMIVEGQVPINIKVFANAILRGRAHPCVYLEWGCGMLFDGRGVVVRTNMEGLQSPDGQCVFANWLYRLDSFSVHVIYAADSTEWDRDRLSRTWHPKFGTNKLVIANFDELVEQAGIDPQ